MKTKTTVLCLILAAGLLSSCSLQKKKDEEDEKKKTDDQTVQAVICKLSTKSYQVIIPGVNASDLAKLRDENIGFCQCECKEHVYFDASSLTHINAVRRLLEEIDAFNSKYTMNLQAQVRVHVNPVKSIKSR